MVNPTRVSHLAAAPWRSILHAQRQEYALTLAREVTRRVADPRKLTDARRSTERSSRRHYRHPYDIATGDAGLAVMSGYANMCLPGEGWDAVAHEFLETSVRKIERCNDVHYGLFGGMSGLAFGAESLSQGGKRYRKLMDALDLKLAPVATFLGAQLRCRAGPGPVEVFDLISGASGVAAYLLRRDEHGVLPEILRGLVALAEERDGMPQWWTPHKHMSDEDMASSYPAGVLNCGIAHGIAGPVAVLALALNEGSRVPGQYESLRTFSDWLVAHRIDDQLGAGWPGVVPIGLADSEAFGYRLALKRIGWCYGTPGVARSLWLAGEALDDHRLRTSALEAMYAVLRRPISERRPESLMLCHGLAGLLQIVLRFWHDTHLSTFSMAATEIVDELIAAYQPRRPLAYASVEQGGRIFDRPGLLNGAPGVAMALFAAATDAEPRWDRLLLLS
ncbi:lanthionine synthetase C family protein [Streptomyces sp. NPDC012935]|uniref:lanthionine synthetase C family protein n=1 Tax=Streptomyces sp. NPDC012935 TaxID=3364857 RepID=UPI003683C4AA